MNLAEFLEDLSQQNIELWLEGDRLRYRGPVPALTPTVLNKIKQHKAEILQLLQKEFHTSKYYPLTYGQQGLWFLYKLTPKSAAYNIAFTARIRSDVNVQALQRALQALIIRHPTLRTTYGQRGAEPFQQVHEYQEICFEKTDASTWNEDELTRRVIEAYRQPFNLEQGPVMRVNLFTRSAQDHVFLLAIHHIAVDGFSFGILLDELRLLYDSEQIGGTVSLPPIRWQYQDFVQWQREFLSSPVGDNLWNYWQKQLAGELPVLNLPTDRPRPAIQNYQGASHTFELSKELTKSLREMAKAEGATLYMTLLTAFVVLLYRYTGQEDIIVGSPTEGRSQPEFDTVVGFFVNMLALRVNIVDNPTFSALLSQVRSTVLGALAHQDYPSSLLIERLQLNRDPSLPGLFRVSFNLLKLQMMAEDYELSLLPSSKARENWAGLLLEPFVIPQQEGQNDIVLDVIESTESLFGIFRYNTDLFDATTISRMASNFQTLLEGIVANQGQQISSLPLLSAAERNYLLLESNNRQVNYPQNQCIHQLFENCVKTTPNAIAVEFQDQKLTYQELNVRANQLAHHLRNLGVRAEVLVGICVERSLEMIVGLLGILKAGGAYVPLDPAYPKERLDFMLCDSQVSVLVTQQKLVDSLVDGLVDNPTMQGIPIVCLDKDWEVIQKQSQVNPLTNVTSKNLAYVIYTSGSTGKPKGVMIEHQSLVSFTHTARLEYGLTKQDRVLQFASISFDAAVEEIYPCLTSGGTLVLRTSEMLGSVPAFVQKCRDMQLTVLDLPTAYWHQWVAELAELAKLANFKMANLAIPESLRLVIIGGEQVNPEKVAMWLHFAGSYPQLVNTYGPTEATVVSTTYLIPGSPLVNIPQRIPIGRANANVQVYVMDKHQQLVPIGVAGELYIGGDNLARGYLNRPDLTEQKFIQNLFNNSKFKIPFGKTSGLQNSKLYKTGDLARYLPDGNIEFLGRIDNQVKIRGFRIELGEIEALLSQHPQIRSAVVKVYEDESGNNKYLVGYVIANQEQPIVSELRSFLKQKLPDYMIPSTFVMLESLPLTPSGKIDLKALKAPDRTRPELEKTFVPPSNPTEELLASIWASVFGFEQIGIQDNFFDLGGHSLMAVQLISKINQKLDKDIPISTLFQHPTVAELATLVTKNVDYSVTHPCLVPIQVGGTQPALFCIHSAGGQVMIYQHLATCLGKDQPVYGLQSRALEDPAIEHESIDSMAYEYANAIRQHQPNGPYCLMGWSMGGAIAVSVAKQLEQQGLDVAFVGLVDALLVPDNAPTWSEPLFELARRFNAAFADTLMAYHPDEKQALQNELIGLSYFDSLRRMMVWGQERNLLSADICFDSLQKQVALNMTHEQLFKGYHPEQIQAKLHIFWAKERLEAGLLSLPDWSKYTKGLSDISILEGNHYNLVRPPYVEALAQRLQFAISAPLHFVNAIN